MLSLPSSGGVVGVSCISGIGIQMRANGWIAGA
jgi:hypothetical protein